MAERTPPSPIPASRQALIDWCLRRLGHPVININLDDDQIEDCFEMAFQYYRDFHYDGVERWYLKHQVTQTDKDNQWIPITENIIGVTKLYNLSASGSSVNMFDLRYQLRMNDLYDFTSASFVNYAMTQNHLRMIEMLLIGEPLVRFSRHTDRLHVDMDWETISVGEYLLVEGHIVIDPEVYNDVYNDRMLKKLMTAYMKLQWGTNLKKFTGMQLPGGIQMNGQQIFDEALAEIKSIEEEIRLVYEAPPMMQVG